ncbi:MAG: DUF427 domain-containing protein [Leifsonia sp.]
MTQEKVTYRAEWHGTVLVESDDTIRVEGNRYFPPESLRPEFFRNSTHSSVCPWKGTAQYFSVDVAGDHNEAAAWYYPNPSTAAQHIRNYMAFWKGVDVVKVRRDGDETAHRPRFFARLMGR